MAIQYFWRHPLAEQVREEGRREGLEQRLVEGWKEMIPRILEWRGIQVPDAVQERVEACTDLDDVELWARRALHAKDADELLLFAGE
ncbi:hypothetical protein [Streptomyces sp. SudanB182_2057]|uniref:hypothetical protein n=1 Tax=Streptomyces sp. SudanB182_2057 TaxID=3035281 RepID=UPI003F5589B5